MRKTLYITSVLITLLVWLVFLASSVLASGVGFTPGKLEFNDNPGNLQNTLYVINTGKETSSYYVYTDEDYADWFIITPDHFSLAPNENLPVQISLSHSEIPKGDHDIKLSVVAFADGIEAKVGTGAKVPVHISITSSIPVSPDEQSVEQQIEGIENVPASVEESLDSPQRIELWVGLIVVLAVAAATIFIFIRRRRNFGTS